VSDFKRYRRAQIAELADWHPGFDMTDVSVSVEDRNAGSPKEGDKIARNPKNHADRWLVAAAYFEDNFEPVAALAEPEPQDVEEITRLDGAALIAHERLRQIERERFTPDYDRGEHGGEGQLVLAGVAYALHYARMPEAASYWPFANEWKPKDDLADLVRAGALIAAEIDLINGTAPSVTDERTRWAEREKELVKALRAIDGAEMTPHGLFVRVGDDGIDPRQVARAALGEERTTDG